MARAVSKIAEFSHRLRNAELVVLEQDLDRAKAGAELGLDPAAGKSIEEISARLDDLKKQLAANGVDVDPTEFTLKPLTALQFMRAGEIFQNQGRAAAAEYTLRMGLRGWARFFDERGEVKFSRDMSENLDRLSLVQIVQLSNAIQEASNITGEEKKT